MGTPNAARHRDLEQRFRDLEKRVDRLTSAALTRQRLNVTEGDFVVSGGGAIVVEDDADQARVRLDSAQAGVYDWIQEIQVPATAITLRDPAGGGTTSRIAEYQTSDGINDFGTCVMQSGEPGNPFSLIYTADTFGYAGMIANNPDGETTASVQVQNTNNGWAYMRASDNVSFSVGSVPAWQSPTVGEFQKNGSFWLYKLGTSSAAANLRINAGGQVVEVTSSERYKQDIEPLDVDPAAILELQPRTWRDKAEVEEEPDTKNRYVGFIAEELDDAGLTEFVDYDGEGRPNAIQYDRLTAALIPLLKQQQGQIDALTARLDALEAK